MESAELLMQNAEFVKAMRSHIDNILADGRIDSADIPEIILMVLDLLDRMDGIHIAKEDFRPFLIEITTRILKLCDVKTSELIRLQKMIDMCITLLMRSVKFQNAISKAFKCLTCHK